MTGASIEPGERRDGFRPDIEGLRAVAVLLVLAYHAGLPGLGGGFVGVDVFFVISGYLITGLLVSEIKRTGSVALPAFYARRARRLLPAAAAVIAATVAVSALVLPPLRLPDIAGDAVASVLYVGNVRFAVQATDYLQAALAPSPLLHYWSLGVEEQFYLVWPAILLGLARLRPGSRRFLAAVAAIGVGSLGASLWLTQRDAPLAFFLLPTRAWELALGAIVWLTAERLSRIPDRTAALAGAGGLLLVLGAGVVIGASTPYPGLAALVPTVGSALILVGGLRRPLAFPSRALAWRPFRWIGRISYSLYLWHWPILVLPAAALGEALSGPVRLGLALATFPIAALGERFIERPVREGRLIRSRPSRTLILAGSTSLAVAVLSAGVGLAVGPPGGTGGPTGGGVGLGGSAPPLVLPSLVPVPFDGGSAAPGAASAGSVSAAAGASDAADAARSLPVTPAGPVPSDLLPPLSQARTDLPPIFTDGCHVPAIETTSPPCVYGDPASKVSVILFGDSHAAQWFPTLQQLAVEHDWRLIDLTKAACPAADLTVWSATLARPYAECDEWRRAALGRIGTERPALVVVSNTRFVDLAIDGAPIPSLARETLWDAALERTLGEVRGSAGSVALIGDTPNPTNDPPVCLSAHGSDALACATPVERAVTQSRLDAERVVAERAEVTFVDPSRWVCPSNPCPAVIGRFLVYRDGGHMSTVFARALAPYLDTVLPPVRG